MTTQLMHPLIRFNLEEEIQNVWNTENDLDTILYRIMDAKDGPPSEDDVVNMLLGLKEIHKSRCIKLWDVFETMVNEKVFDQPNVESKTEC